MSEPMLEILKALAHGVGGMTYGDPDATDAVSAADVIRWAVAEIARLREERRWVPVGERLPTVQGDDVLTARGPWEDGGYSISRGWWNGECWMSYGSDRDMPPVAFWQPLPPGPEEMEKCQ